MEGKSCMGGSLSRKQCEGNALGFESSAFRIGGSHGYKNRAGRDL
jgi:hypothetical protein